MRFYGNVGYVDTVETKPGVWEEVYTERPYYGDMNRMIGKWQSSDKLTDDKRLNNEISIVADEYAFKHFSAIHYVVIEGVKWKVDTITVLHPRLILEVGGVFNEREQTT